METISSESNKDHPSLLDNIILHEDDLTSEAKSQFGFHTEILRALEMNRRNILSSELLTCIGRHVLLSCLQDQHSQEKKVLNYMATNNNPLIKNLPINGPLIICGLPRTGSTLLYNLLACDSNCRAPLFTEMFIEAVPPISRSNITEQERRNQLLPRPVDLTHCRPIFTIEEDSGILEHVGVNINLMFACSNNQPEYDAWFLDERNKDFAYDYHETFLRMLNSVDAPSSHWLLKAPAHSFYLDTLFHHYPRVSLIMIHRRLDEVIPSLCSYATKATDFYFDKNDASCRNLIMTQIIQAVDKIVFTMAGRIVKFRNHGHYVQDESRKAILDILYDDLMARPLATVRCIYDHFGLNWSDEFEMAMETWLRKNPQGKQGRHNYTLNEFGLKREDIEVRYADYINMFLGSLSSFESPPKSISNGHSSSASN